MTIGRERLPPDVRRSYGDRGPRRFYRRCVVMGDGDSHEEPPSGECRRRSSSHDGRACVRRLNRLQPALSFARQRRERWAGRVSRVDRGRRHRGGAGPARVPAVEKGRRRVRPVGHARGSQERCHRQCPTHPGSRATGKVCAVRGIGTLTALNKGKEMLPSLALCMRFALSLINGGRRADPSHKRNVGIPSRLGLTASARTRPGGGTTPTSPERLHQGAELRCHLRGGSHFIPLGMIGGKMTKHGSPVRRVGPGAGQFQMNSDGMTTFP